MSRSLRHPTREQIDLPMVLDCLSDPTRLAIVYTLAKREGATAELCCGDFNALSGKSNLAYHFAKLRESGVMPVETGQCCSFERATFSEIRPRVNPS